MFRRFVRFVYTRRLNGGEGANFFSNFYRYRGAFYSRALGYVEAYSELVDATAGRSDANVFCFLYGAASRVFSLCKAESSGSGRFFASTSFGAISVCSDVLKVGRPAYLFV